MKYFIIFPLAIILKGAIAQEQNDSPVTLSAYLESYYTYDFNRPENNTRPGFLYNHSRHNEVNVNLAFVKAAYASEKVRANLALMAGTYANANLAAEPGVLKNLFEANVGVRLSKNLWLDAGIFPSHIGFESAISKDCWNLTRGLLAENSPYYESGAKLTFTTDAKWTISALLLNGWQRIQRVDGNSTPAFGAQVIFKPSDRFTFNYSNFIGSDKPDAERRWRIFHNLYGIIRLSDKFGLTAGLDVGMEQESKGNDEYNVWFTPIIVGQYLINDRWALAARAEYYQDKEAVIIGIRDFAVSGFSLNVDFQPVDQAVLRVEGRLLQSADEIFIQRQGSSRQNFCMTTSLAVSF